MRKFLFVLASTGSLATMNVAIAQYPASEYYATGYYVPGYYGRRYYAPGYPGYYAPGYYSPGYTAPGYRWREQRLNEEQRTDGQLNYEKQRTPNNAIGSGAIGLSDPNAVGGECAKGFSEETCRRRGQRYNPPGQN